MFSNAEIWQLVLIVLWFTAMIAWQGIKISNLEERLCELLEEKRDALLAELAKEKE